jgi:signal transduction histidine kinase
MSARLRVLHLEDNQRDAELIHTALQNGGLECEIVLVQSRQDFLEALKQGRFDLILSDYGLSGYDGLSALGSAHEAHPEVPFILVSGTLGEEEAVESLKSGATDYILKNRLTRLVPAVSRALDDARKRAQLKESEVRFLRAQRLEAIGALASGIAHDLNNILAPIMMSAPMLRWGLKPEEMEKTVLSIETSAQRGADLVKQLLLFGRGVEGNRTSLQPKHLIRDMVRMVRETFPKAISLETKTASDLWTITADATQIHQVLLNLCVNARDAMPKGGKLSLSAENVQLDDHYAGMIEAAKAGPYVLLRVADTGEGIPAGILERVFDPFFTTKEPGHGTGLGLSTVLGIIKSHAGFVDLRSEVGKGSTFSVYLPATPNAPEAESGAPPAKVISKGDGEMILVVDDEPEILKITQQNLERNGYRTVLAADGIEALVLFTRRQEEIQAVLTDLEMPLMDGVNLVRAIRKLDSEVQVIASSGIGLGPVWEEKMANLTELGVTTLLTKPYGADTLLHALKDALRKQP